MIQTHTVHSLAAQGASLRLAELAAERRAILKQFPGAEHPETVGAIHAHEEKPATAHKRKRMSKAARRAIAIRMRKYWKVKRSGK